MDTSHINRIGKLLDKSDKLPCCSSDGSEEYEVNPSSWTFDDLVAQPPFFETPTRCEDFVITTVERIYDDDYGNEQSDSYKELSDYNLCTDARLSAKQKSALDGYQVLHNSVLQNLGPMRPNIDDMKQYAVCFDDFYFDGRIMPRCSIQWIELKDGSTALTHLLHLCHDHQQCHSALIDIDRLSEFNKEDDQSFSPERLGHLLTVLVHEMIHAWIVIFSDNTNISLEEALEQRGDIGHGLAWGKLMHKTYKEGLHYFKLPAFDWSSDQCRKNTDCDHIELQLQVDQGDMWEVENLSCFIEQRAKNSEEIYEEISKTLRISKEAAMYYDALLENDYEILEALWLLRDGPKTAFFWNQRGRKVPLPSNYFEMAVGRVDKKD